MNSSPIDLELLEQKLQSLAVDINQSESDQSWYDVQSAAQALANGLRVRDGPVDNHSKLGKAALPQTLTTLLTLSLHGSTIPDVSYTSAIFELLRVAANLCMDHDENRAQLLEAGLPQAIVSLLEGYADTLPPPPHIEPSLLSIPHLKVIKTSIGVLLNASIGYDPVKFRLISLEAAITILKLSTAIYPPGSWITAFADSPKEVFEETWTLRSGLSNWAWRTISELNDVKDESLQIFTPDVLPLLMPPLRAFSPPYPTASTNLPEINATSSNALLHADFEVLEESCMLIESLSLDVEDVRLSLARGLHFPAEHGGIPCLSTILDFIEFGHYPPTWRSSILGEAEKKRKEKAFDICKAALIKSVVEVAGEESNEDVLWDDSDEAQPGGEFVCRMVRWIKKFVADMASVGQDSLAEPALDRNDLVICASLSLGNLARREKNTVVLLSPPHSLAPILTSATLMSPLADIKMKHGIIGLLKHFAQSSAQSSIIHTALRNAGVVRCISESGIWEEKTDAMAEVVQMGAIGVVKHLCSAKVEHTFALVLPAETQTSKAHTGLSQILALVKRSDSVPVKSEGTRVLVNVIKSLWNDPNNNNTLVDSSSNGHGSPENGNTEEIQKKRQASISQVTTAECAFALASLVTRSGKYPLLVNEGIVALSLLSTQNTGASFVLPALMINIQPDVALTAEPSSASNSDVSSPALNNRHRLPVPRTALDMLVSVLKNVDNPSNFPVEVRVNVCSLLLQIGMFSSGDELLKVQQAVRPTLEKVAESTQGAQGKEEVLAKATKKLLENWV